MKNIFSKLKLKLRFILIALVIATFALEGVNVYLSNQVSTESVTVTKLNSQMEEIDRQNYTVRSEVLMLTSLEQVASRAARLGFVETKKSISLYDAPQVAIR